MIRILKKVRHVYLLGTVIAAIKHCTTRINISRNKGILNKKMSQMIVSQTVSLGKITTVPHILADVNTECHF
jgi:hypothetical protein